MEKIAIAVESVSNISIRRAFSRDARCLFDYPSQLAIKRKREFAGDIST